MGDRKTKNDAMKFLCSVKTNIFKHKRTPKSENHINKPNWTIPPKGSSLSQEELKLLWVIYNTQKHYRDESNKQMKTQYNNKSRNENVGDENFTSENNQSICITSSNTWNWEQVTQINQSAKNWNGINSINITNDTSDTYDFAEVFFNQEWLQEKNTSPLSNSESNVNEFYYNNNFIFDKYSEMLEPNHYEFVNNRFHSDYHNKNVDQNISSNFEYHNCYNQYDYNINDNTNDFFQSLETMGNNFNELDYTIYDIQNESSISGNLEGFSL